MASPVFLILNIVGYIENPLSLHDMAQSYMAPSADVFALVVGASPSFIS